VESIADEPPFAAFEHVVDTLFPRVLHPLSHREIAVALKLDFGETR
jgi:hypothetical protein